MGPFLYHHNGTNIWDSKFWGTCRYLVPKKQQLSLYIENDNIYIIYCTNMTMSCVIKIIIQLIEYFMKCFEIIYTQNG